MSELLLDRQLHSETHVLGEARVIARMRSRTALSRLDSDHKKRVLEFLYESQLINREQRVVGDRTFEARVVGLAGANLTKANLRYLTLEAAALDGAILENADLSRLGHKPCHAGVPRGWQKVARLPPEGAPGSSCSAAVPWGWRQGGGQTWPKIGSRRRAVGSTENRH
jgi:hypothetical protein